MKSLLALLRTYFIGTPLGLRVSAVSALVIVVALASRLVYPEFAIMFQTGDMRDASPMLMFFVAATPMLGMFGLFFGTFMLPVVLGHLSMTRRLDALPRGRGTIIVSAFACVAIVALVNTAIFALYVPAIYRQDLLILSGALGGFTLLYIALWLVTRSRTTFGKLASSMLLLAALTLPTWLAPRVGVVGRFVAVLALWAMIAATIGRARHAPELAARVKAWLTRVGGSPAQARLGRPLNERERVAAFAGTARPWLVAFGPVVPFLIAMAFVRPPEGWLFYLSVFAMLSGAMASLAARRSRPLWLRAGWSRDQIFAHLERAFWRQNLHALTVLIAAHVSICVLFALPFETTVLGVPLLCLAAATSTCLGLMMTRRIHIAEIPIAVATMIIVMTTAVSITDARIGLQWSIAQMLVLAAASVAFRVLALRRWREIDWSLAQASAPQEA